ncbi:MAG: NAD(P)H-hydrate epimerase, partial [Phycisphaerae bacterium]
MPPDKALTRDQIRRIDRLAIEEYGVPGIVLMENAGRNAARVIRREVLSTPTGGSVAVVCGSGNNGGDGFVVARHLANCSIDVALYLASDPARLSGDAAVNYGIVRRMGLPIMDVRAPGSLAAAMLKWRACDVIVDALLG